jgi:hypothetical protein
MLKLEVSCPKCKADLADDAVAVAGDPGLHFLIACEGEEGSVYLSPRYGCHETIQTIELPAGAAVDFFCPHCREPLNTSQNCPDCAAARVDLELAETGGLITFCSRYGCQNHEIRFQDASTEMRLFLKRYYAEDE